VNIFKRIPTWFLIVLIAVALILTLVESASAQTNLVPRSWTHDTAYPNRWCTELSEKEGDLRLCAAYGHGKEPLYSLRMRCKDGRYSFTAWFQGGKVSGAICPRESLDRARLVRDAGALPEALTEILKQPPPRRFHKVER
jgi:hypothetical protein